jgi:hypothetical protein
MRHNFRPYTKFTFHSLMLYIIKVTNGNRNGRCTLPVKERQLVKNLGYASSMHISGVHTGYGITYNVDQIPANAGTRLMLALFILPLGSSFRT